MKRIEIPIPEHTTKEELKALVLKHLEEASTDVSSSIEKIVIVAEDKMPGGGDQGKGLTGGMRVCLVTAATATDFEDPEEARSASVRISAAEPHLGILTLASVLESHGVSVSVIDLNELYYQFLDADEAHGAEFFVDWAAHRVVASFADIYGLSSICSSYPLTIRLAERIKTLLPGCTIALGGPQATVVDLKTLEAFPFIDAILRGEADYTFPMFLAEWEQGRRFERVSGLTFRSPFGPARTGDAQIVENLDAIPVPAYHLSTALQNATRASLELGRGCPFACTFCSTNDFFRRKFRVKSPARVLTEMQAISTRYGLNDFALVHDMFTVDRRRVVAFCKYLLNSRSRFTWSCSARTDSVDEELLELMAEAGCKGMFFGVETGSRRMQKIIGKHLDPDQARAMISAAENRGIETTVSLITGFPEERPDDLEDSLTIYMHSLSFPTSTPQLNLLAPLAETPLYGQYKDQLTLEELCSDMSRQGRLQNASDLALIKTYPEIFPNFYSVPLQHLDREFCVELREFLLMGRVRFRWLIVALGRQTGGVLGPFSIWRNWRMKFRASLGGGVLRHYYTTDGCRLDFVQFVRSQPQLAKSPDVEALLDYEDALREATLEQSELRPQGELVAGDIRGSDIPFRRHGITVFALPWDIQKVIDGIKSGSKPAQCHGEKFYRTALSAGGSIRLLEISELLARTLRVCDGHANVAAFMLEAESCFSGTGKVKSQAAQCLLEIMRESDLVEIYRTQSPSAVDRPAEESSCRVGLERATATLQFAAQPGSGNLPVTPHCTG